MRGIKLTAKKGQVVAAFMVGLDDEIFVIASGGIVIRMPVREISSQGRDATGVRVMNLDDDQTVAAVAPVLGETDDDDARPAPRGPAGGAHRADGALAVGAARHDPDPFPLASAGPIRARHRGGPMTGPSSNRPPCRRGRRRDRAAGCGPRRRRRRRRGQTTVAACCSSACRR